MLKLRSLELKNFMSIADAQLDFNQKVTAIIGKNGFGKSAVFEAVAFCLTGSKRGDKISQYIRQGSSFFEIKLQAEIYNEPAEFYYYYSDKESKRTVSYKGKIYSKSECDAIIEDLDLDFYAKILFSMQNEVLVSEMTAAERRSYLSKLLDFDFTEPKDLLHSQIQELEEQNIKSKARESSLQQSIQEKQSLMKEVPALSFTEADVEQIKKDLLSFDIGQIRDLSEKKTKLLSQKSSIEYKLQDLAKDEERLEALEKKEEDLGQKIKETKPSQVSFKEQEDKIAELKSKIEEAASLIEAESKKEVEVKIKLNELNHQKKLCEQGRCPECGREYEGAHIEEILEKTSEAAKEMKDIAEKKSSYLLEKRDMEAEKDDLADEISRKKHEADLQQSLSSQYKQQLLDLQNELKTLRSIDYTVERSSQEQSLEDVKKSLEETDLEAAKLDKLRSEYAEKQKLLRQYENAVTERKAVIESNERLRSSMLDNKNEIEEVRNSIAATAKAIERKDIAYKILQKDLPSYMTLKTCAIVEKEMNSFIKSTMPDKTIFFQPSKNGIDFFYAEGLSEVNSASNVKMASGFEKKLFSVAFKVALNRAYGLGFIILDEIDSDADEENSDSMFSTIINEGAFDQIFIISHKQEVVESLASSNSSMKILYMPKKGEFVEE